MTITEEILPIDSSAWAAYYRILELMINNTPLHAVLAAVLSGAVELAQCRGAVFGIEQPDGEITIFSNARSDEMDGSASSLNCREVVMPFNILDSAEGISSTKRVMDFAESQLAAQKNHPSASWAFPLLSPRNEILGILVLYHDSPRAPTRQQVVEIKCFAKLASIRIWSSLG